MLPTSSNTPRWGAAELTGRSRAHVIGEDGIVLQSAALGAFAQMRAAAAAAGLDLAVASSFRDFDTQCRIWNAKWRGERPVLDSEGRPVDVAAFAEPVRVALILLWSALPGASRHHWGSDLDVYDRAGLRAGERPQLVPAEYADGGPFARLTAWLDGNMATFGFYRPYARDRGGVRPEPWHLSHAPTAVEMSRRLRPATLRRAIEGAPIDGKAHLLNALDSLYARYVRRVEAPPATARARGRSDAAGVRRRTRRP